MVKQITLNSVLHSLEGFDGEIGDFVPSMTTPKPVPASSDVESATKDSSPEKRLSQELASIPNIQANNKLTILSPHHHSESYSPH